MVRRVCWCLAAAGLCACGRKETVARFPEGQPKIVCIYTAFGPKDSLHLRVETAYFLNGKPEFEAHFHGGQFDGEYKAYWENGQIQSRGRYRAGRREGPWQFFFNRYALSSKGAYQDGLKQGQWIEYWENGELRRRGAYRDGREIGTFVAWNRHGDEVLRTSCFAANDTGHYHSSYDSGGVYEDYACRRGHIVGPYLARYPDGTVRERGFYDTSGARDSLWESFHPDGRLASRRHFRGGLWNDSALGWDTAGRVRESGFFRDGTGVLTRFDSLGRVSERYSLVVGREDGEHWTYYPDGGKRRRIRYLKGDPVDLQDWFENGAPEAQGAFHKGKKEGLWQRWDQQGRLRETAHFVAGELQGERRFFDSTGRVQRIQDYEHGFPTRGSFPGLPGGVKRKAVGLTSGVADSGAK